MSAVTLHQDPNNCVICLEAINPQAVSDQEQPSELKCHHIFHKECITEWLKVKHNCPTCRAPALISEMLPQEILAVPDSESTSYLESNQQALAIVRERVLHERNIRQIRLDEDTPVAETARKIHSVAAKVFGW